MTPGEVIEYIKQANAAHKRSTRSILIHPRILQHEVVDISDEGDYVTIVYRASDGCIHNFRCPVIFRPTTSRL